MSIATSHSLPELTPDPMNLSNSYRGISRRRDMLLGIAISAILRCLTPGIIEDGLPPYFMYTIVLLALHIIFYLPLTIRSARRLGAVWYGALVLVIVNTTPFIIGIWYGHTIQTAMEWEKTAEELEMFVETQVTTLVIAVTAYLILELLLYLPFCLVKGPLYGAKNELMRAAISNDMNQVKQPVSSNPYALLQKSEQGFTARDYATRLGYSDIAAYLQAEEARL